MYQYIFNLDEHLWSNTPRTPKTKPNINPLMSPETMAAERQWRYLERTWRKKKTALYRSKHTRQTHLCNRMMSKPKSSYYFKIIITNVGDKRSLWKADVTLMSVHVTVWMLITWQPGNYFRLLLSRKNRHRPYFFFWCYTAIQVYHIQHPLYVMIANSNCSSPLLTLQYSSLTILQGCLASDEKCMSKTQPGENWPRAAA